MRIARATVELRKAELLLANVVQEVEQLRNAATAEPRARWGAWMTEVAHTSRRIVVDLAGSAGAGAHFRTHPLQRTVRDLNTLCCHVALNQDAQQENLGRILLGLEGNSPL